MHGLPDDEMNSFDDALFLNLDRMTITTYISKEVETLPCNVFSIHVEASKYFVKREIFSRPKNWSFSPNYTPCHI